jgi:hypothetical protein
LDSLRLQEHKDFSTHYVISLSSGDRFSWAIQISGNGSDWIEIDRRMYTRTVTVSYDHSELVVFEASKRELIQFVKFVAIDTKSSPYSTGYCTGLDFFGYLTE